MKKLTDYNYIFIANKVQIDSPENISYAFKHCLFHKNEIYYNKKKPDIYTVYLSIFLNILNSFATFISETYLLQNKKGILHL